MPFSYQEQNFERKVTRVYLIEPDLTIQPHFLLVGKIVHKLEFSLSLSFFFLLLLT